MSALVFTLRDKPEQRLDLSALIPDRLARLSLKEIENIALETTRIAVRAGDIFRIRKGDAADIRFAGGSDRFDRVGEAMSGGSIALEGHVGARAGRLMRGGTLAISGNVGPWAGSGMAGGTMTIGGNAGDWLGGPLAGELAGMCGGVLLVKGNTGQEAGHRLRRGTLIVAKTAGAYAGRAMIAGTLLIGGRAGPMPGYLMRRGTIVLGEPPEALSPAFLDSGPVELVFARLLAASLHKMSPALAGTMKRPLRRLAGDVAVNGKGEILLPV